VMTASGAFRPVRFFIGHFTTDNDFQMFAFQNNGDYLPITSTDNYFFHVSASPNEFHWYNDRQTTTSVWYRGREETFYLGENYLYSWSNNGQLAFTQVSEDHNELWVWTEGTRKLITSTSEEVISINWVNESELMWIEIHSPESWKLMRWQAGTLEEVYRGTETIDFGGATRCAYYLTINGDQYLYHDYQIYPIPNGATWRPEIQVDDCENFSLNVIDQNNNHLVRLWNGTNDFVVPFEVYARHGEFEWLGLEISPDNTNHWALVYKSSDQVRHFDVEPNQDRDKPELLLWSSPYTIWYIRQNSEHRILIWNTDTGHADLLSGSSNGMRILNSEFSGLAAWIDNGGYRETWLNIWEGQQLTQYLLPQDGIFVMLDSTPELHWLSDGSLFLYSTQYFDHGEYRQGTYIYRWDGQALQLFSYFPYQGWLVGDWVTWE
jgi:hypothetical protein